MTPYLRKLIGDLSFTTMWADISASRYYRPQGKKTCSCFIYSQLPRMDIPSSKSIQSQIWRNSTAKIDRFGCKLASTPVGRGFNSHVRLTSIMLRLTTQSLRIRTLNNKGPLCVCTTHMRVKHPPLPIRKEKLVLAGMGIGSPTHQPKPLSLNRAVIRPGVNKKTKKRKSLARPWLY